MVMQRAVRMFTRCREAASDWKLFLRTCGCLLLTGLLATAILPAQQSASPQPTWSGIVRNDAGQPLAGVAVTVRTAQNKKHTAVSDPDGQFAIPGLLPGEYTVTAQLPGGPATAPLTISISGGTPIILTLSDQNTLAVVEPPAPTPVAPSTTAATSGATGGEKLSSQSVSQLPLNGRDFSTLLLLAAGTMTDTNGATNFTQQFAINGQRGVEAAFAMDGADISDPEMGGTIFTNFNVDAIQELQSSSGWMPAEIGRGAAGFTNIVTRSGSSGFHGSFFEFLRNSALDARNYFDHPSIAEPGRIPPFRRNEFGFTNGGPVVLPHSTTAAAAPSTSASIRDSARSSAPRRCSPCPPPPSAPATTPSRIPTARPTRCRCPSTPTSPPSSRAIPCPTIPPAPIGARTYAAPSNVNTDADQFSIRIDQKLGPKGQFLGRFTYDNLTGPTTNPDQTLLDPTFAVQYVDRQRNVVFTYTRTVSPRFLWSASFSITRTTPSFPTPNHTDPALKFTTLSSSPSIPPPAP